MSLESILKIRYSIQPLESVLAPISLSVLVHESDEPGEEGPTLNDVFTKHNRQILLILPLISGASKDGFSHHFNLL